MHARHLSTAFLTAGLLVGALAGLGLLVGFEPARLPAVLLNIAAYKLAFLAALSLVAAGGVIGRYAQRRAVPPAPLPREDARAPLGRPAGDAPRCEPQPAPARVARS
jgi:hypothetical protein